MLYLTVYFINLYLVLNHNYIKSINICYLFSIFNFEIINYIYLIRIIGIDFIIYLL